jgi:hypothetical protein
VFALPPHTLLIAAVHHTLPHYGMESDEVYWVGAQEGDETSVVARERG